MGYPTGYPTRYPMGYPLARYVILIQDLVESLSSNPDPDTALPGASGYDTLTSRYDAGMAHRLCRDRRQFSALLMLMLE